MQNPPSSPEKALNAYRRIIANLTIWGGILSIIGVLFIGLEVAQSIRAEDHIPKVPPETLLLIIGLYALRFREALTFAVVAVVSLFAGLPEAMVEGLGTFSSLLNLFVFAVLIGQFFSSSTLRRQYENLSKEKLPATSEAFVPLASVIMGVCGGLTYAGFLLLQVFPATNIVGSITLIFGVLALGFGLASLLANLQQRVFAIVGALLGAAVVGAWVLTIASNSEGFLLG